MSPKVKVIVMITRLVEGEGSKRRKKADCYWPDRKVIMVELGMMVPYLIFVTDTTDGVRVNFFGWCKFLQI